MVSKKSGPNGLLLIVTDKDILGKTFIEGNKQLDLTKVFYQGEEMDKEQVLKLFTQARDIHLTGKYSVGLGVETNYVDPNHILYVDKVPHAEVVVSE
ncbi:MAG: DUF424 family protein [Candidatus Woesearchaeota archaeon]